MIINAYLNFDGNCREAIEFYASVFGVDMPELFLYGDMPDACPNDFPFPEEAKKLVAHAMLDIRGNAVMFSDVPPGTPFAKGQNVTLIVTDEDVEEIKTLFGKMKEGGTVGMDLQATFWSKAYGYVVDRFGVAWQFNHRDKCG